MPSDPVQPRFTARPFTDQDATTRHPVASGAGRSAKPDRFETELARPQKDLREFCRQTVFSLGATSIVDRGLFL
jgi:hypothetical protein